MTNPISDPLREAAQAVLDCWDSRNWKAAPTADYMRRLRAALAAAPQPAMREETGMEHIARDIREGRFPERSPRQQVPVEAAPQPAPTHECPVCEETVTWTRPGSPYCGECAADNGRDVRMRSIGTASQPAPDREALVEVIAQIIDHPSVYMGGPSRNSLRIAEAIVKECGNALLARGMRLPG